MERLAVLRLLSFLVNFGGVMDGLDGISYWRTACGFSGLMGRDGSL